MLDEHTLIPFSDIKLENAKVAMAQVTKRLEGHLALKTATESRATVLATNCVAILTAIVGATAYQFNVRGFSPLIVTGVVAALCLLQSLMFSYLVIRPSSVALPGHLPSDLWNDLITESMNEKSFITRLVVMSQVDMEENERSQNEKGIRLRLSIWSIFLTVPISAIAFALASLIS